MEEIVRDGLPTSLYDFQFTLSNRNRPDCIIRIPGNTALLVIDSKFPLEAFEALRRAATDEEKKAALAQVRASVSKHVTDIADKYLIPGEVQTPAIMFVPSESLYADLHDGFSDVIQKAHRANVIVVSPNILMLAINTIQTVMKDARMREQADLIRKEVGVLLNDVRLLNDRVLQAAKPLQPGRCRHQEHPDFDGQDHRPGGEDRKGRTGAARGRQKPRILAGRIQSPRRRPIGA